MFTLCTTFNVFAAASKRKDFKKLGKKIQIDRDVDVGKMKDSIRDEQRRMKEHIKENDKLIKLGSK
mgnify:CR=1 FL=1